MFLFASCQEDYDDTALWDAVNNHEERLAALEQWQEETNHNIAAIQQLLNTTDCITAITPLMEGGQEVGYTITFLHSDPITIYHGKKGDKGDKGEQGDTGDKGEQGDKGDTGADGHTPQIGLTQKEDGNWYWTLDGQLMTDPQGNPIRANGEDGKDGQDGADGQPGQDGQDGTPAPTPQISLGSSLTTGTIMTDNGTKQADAWYLSVDGGQTWYRISGEDGEDGDRGPTGPQGPTGQTGPEGATGKPGDSFFASAPTLSEDGTHYIFTLADEDSDPIIVPAYQTLTISEGTGLITLTGTTTVIDLTYPTGTTAANYTALVAQITPEGADGTYTDIDTRADNAAGWSVTANLQAQTVTVTAAGGNALLRVTLVRNDGSELAASCIVSLPYVIDEETDTYTVYTPQGLLAWNEAAQSDLSLNCTLTENINLTGKEWTPVGNSFQTYNGTFDGQGYSITGLNASSLFGGIGESATVKNLQLVDVKLNESSGATAGIVVNNYGTIMACSMTGEISAYSYTSGIANFNLGTIVACWFSGTLKENEGYGIVAFNYGTITACFWDGNTTNGYRSNEGRTVEATKVEGTITWQTAVDGMNAALTGNDYQWALGTDGLPLVLVPNKAAQ